MFSFGTSGILGDRGAIFAAQERNQHPSITGIWQLQQEKDLNI